MREVSFVQHLEFEFKGNIAKSAISLGDVDNDGDSELAVGNLQGDLAVFKGQNLAPWAEAHELGMIMVVVTGDILNEHKNSLISISGEGWCHIFNIGRDQGWEEERKNLQPFHTQRLPANTKVALLADVDGDGDVELVLGLTDHVLRTYRWVKISQGSVVKGKLVGLHKWEFADQIGSISLNPTNEGGPCVLVAQPGGTYINFQCPVVQASEKDEEVVDSTVISKLTPKHHPLALSRMRNPNISSEILGGIRGVRNKNPTSSLIAIATLDGTLMLLDGDEILWSLQVDHQLFALTKLDLIGDGQEEVIACSWDGQTYMVNQQRESVRFQFEEPVCTFTAGSYSVIPQQEVPVLVYATFSDKVFLYYNVRLSSFRTHSFIEAMRDHPETASLLAQLSVDADDDQQLRELYEKCLYELPRLLSLEEDSGKK